MNKTTMWIRLRACAGRMASARIISARHTALVIGCCVAASVVHEGGRAHGQVANGSLTGAIANGGVPPSWSVILETPDTMNAANNVGVAGLQGFCAFPNPSPDGGTWVGIGADVRFVEEFGQTLAGLTVGQQYLISWSAGNFGLDSSGYNQSNAFEARINNVVVGTGATLACGPDWFAQSVLFTATTTNPSLSFRLATSAKAYLSIDGIAVTAIPEPASFVLATLACIAGRAMARRRPGCAA